MDTILYLPRVQANIKISKEDEHLLDRPGQNDTVQFVKDIDCKQAKSINISYLIVMLRSQHM